MGWRPAWTAVEGFSAGTGTDSDPDPGTDSDPDPGTDSDSDPGTDSDPDPGTDSGARACACVCTRSGGDRQGD